jgi:outer membrane protein OmpA-like peptidoglycan-associated protein
MHRRALLVSLFILFFLSGCAGKTLIVLVPDRDGTTGRINVSNTAGTVAIENPNQAVTVKDNETPPGKIVDMKKEEIDALFSDVLSMEPTPSERFILYFENNDVELTSDSLNLIPEILSCIKKRTPTEISVIGHTDTLGDEDANMALSKRRADAVKALLIEKGLDPDFIRATSHGEANPLIKTEDNVSEPRNRRVEVIVR